MGCLTITKQVTGNEIELFFSGKLNEDAELMQYSSLPAKRIIFNFKELTMINSCGVREWVNFLHKIPDTVELIYRNCPYVVVQQASLILGFIREGSHVESIFADFYCPECNEENHVLVNIGKTAFPPEVICQQCQVPMELDALEEEYDSFLKQIKC